MAELRHKIVARLEAGDAPSMIARNFSIARCTVYSAKRLYEETGGFLKRCSPGWPRSVQTEALINAVNQDIKKNPRKNIRQLARDHKVDKSSMSNLVRKDLKLKSRAVVKVQSLTALQRQKRVERCKKMLNWLKSNP